MIFDLAKARVCNPDSMSSSKTSRAVVLLSGGMDSSVCAALAVRDHEAAAVHISYGQRTEERERQSFLAICQRLKIHDKLMVRNEASRNGFDRMPKVCEPRSAATSNSVESD